MDNSRVYTTDRIFDRWSQQTLFGGPAVYEFVASDVIGIFILIFVVKSGPGTSSHAPFSTHFIRKNMPESATTKA